MFLLRKLSGKYELTTACPGTVRTSSHTEDDSSEQVVDQASELVREGKYEKALWMLEKLGQLDPAVKGVAELVAVAEVSYAAAWRSCSCLSTENGNPDWYKILKVDEKSELSMIKKRYRYLALMLHPDKNKHVKAEAAFKLVSEAYACLSDRKKRANFNVKRSLTKCRRCSLKDCISSDADRFSHHVFTEKNTGLQRAGSSPNLTQADWILDQERLRIFRARARARVFGNLARAWKERVFTKTGDFTVAKERFRECKVKHDTMTSDLHHCRENTYEINKKRKEKSNTRPEPSPMTTNNDMTKGSVGDINHVMVSRPCKNLGVLISDLQAELVSSIDESEESSTQENQTDTRDSESHVQEGAEACVEGDSAQHLSGALRACVENYATNAPGNSHLVSSGLSHSYPDGVLHDSLSASENDACSTTSKSCSSKGCSLSEKGSKPFMKVESDSVIECEILQEDEGNYFVKNARKDEECDSTVSKKFHLCRRIGRGDSLDLEEAILQNQKEKSEQLLKTLQRLREETKTVAASLDHLSSGCRY